MEHSYRADCVIEGDLLGGGDYYGTGDSAGELEDGTLAGWEGDIRTALEELAETSQARAQRS